MVGKWLVVACTIWALPTLAQEVEEEADEEAEATPGTDDRARAYFVLGRSAYDAGDYVEAIEQFGRAYELSGRADLLFNLYQAHHRGGNLEEAVDYLERYLEQGSPDDLQRGTLTERLSNLRRERDERREAEAEAERRRLEELERTRRQAAEDASNPVRTGGIVVLGIAGAAVAGFGLFAGLALKEDNDLADSCGADAGRFCSGGDVGRLQTLSRAADVSLGLAGAALITGVIMVVVGKPSSESVTVDASLDPRSAGLRVRGTF